MRTVKEAFEAFHEANPLVWDQFRHLALDLIARGRTHYSAYAIMHVVRYHRALRTSGDEFKINNNFVPLYARLFMREYPDHAGFFSLRKSYPDRPARVAVADSEEL